MRKVLWIRAFFFVFVYSISVHVLAEDSPLSQGCERFSVGNKWVIRHNGNVYSAQFSPDGTHVVTASDDNTANSELALFRFS